MQFSITLRTGIIVALCLYVCIAVVSTQTTTPVSSIKTTPGSSAGSTTPTTTNNSVPQSSKGDKTTTTNASKNETSGNNGSWRLESSWVVTSLSAILILSRMSV